MSTNGTRRRHAGGGREEAVHPSPTPSPGSAAPRRRNRERGLDPGGGEVVEEEEEVVVDEEEETSSSREDRSCSASSRSRGNSVASSGGSKKTGSSSCGSTTSGSSSSSCCSGDDNGSEDVGDGGDEAACDVCRDGYWNDDNPILLCDGGCGRGTHLSCYGVLAVPEGDWLCGTCAAGYDGPCAVCGRVGGMMRRLAGRSSVASAAGGGSGGSGGGGGKGGPWIHVVCALTVDGVVIEHVARMDPITFTGDAAAWAGGKRSTPCDLCGARVGARLRCAVPACRAVFHASCAADAGWRLDLRATAYKAPAYCSRHDTEAGGNCRQDGFKEDDVVGLLDGIGVCNRAEWAARQPGGDGSSKGGGAALPASLGADGAIPPLHRPEANAATAGKMPHAAGYHVRRAVHPDDIAEAAAAVDRVVAAPSGTAFARMGTTVDAVMVAMAAAASRHTAALAALRVAGERHGARDGALRAAAAAAEDAAEGWDDALLGSPDLFGRATDYWKAVLPRWWARIPAVPPDLPPAPAVGDGGVDADADADGLAARFILRLPPTNVAQVSVPPPCARHRWNYGVAATLLQAVPPASPSRTPGPGRRPKVAAASVVGGDGGFAFALVEGDEVEEGALEPLLAVAPAGAHGPDADADTLAAVQVVVSDGSAALAGTTVAQLQWGAGGEACHVDAELALVQHALAAARSRSAWRAAAALDAHRRALVVDVVAARHDIESLAWLKLHALLNARCPAPRPCASRLPCPHRSAHERALAAALYRAATAPPEAGSDADTAACYDMLPSQPPAGSDAVAAPPPPPAAAGTALLRAVYNWTGSGGEYGGGAELNATIAAALASAAEWQARWEAGASSLHPFALPPPVAAVARGILEARRVRRRAPAPEAHPRSRTRHREDKAARRAAAAAEAAAAASEAAAARAAWLDRRVAWLASLRRRGLTHALAAAAVSVPASSPGGAAPAVVYPIALPLPPTAPPAARFLAGLVASVGVGTPPGGAAGPVLLLHPPPVPPGVASAPPGSSMFPPPVTGGALPAALNLVPAASSYIKTDADAWDAADAVLGCVDYLVRRVEAQEAGIAAARMNGGARGAPAKAVRVRRSAIVAAPGQCGLVGGGASDSDSDSDAGRGSDGSGEGAGGAFSGLPHWLRAMAAAAAAALPLPPSLTPGIDAAVAGAILSEYVDGLFGVLRQARGKAARGVIGGDVAAALVEARLTATPPVTRSARVSRSGEELFCVCATPHDPEQLYIGCDACGNWYHLACVGVPPLQARYGIIAYACAGCGGSSRRVSWVRAADDPVWQDARAAAAAIARHWGAVGERAAVAYAGSGDFPLGSEPVPWRTDAILPDSAWAAFRVPPAPSLGSGLRMGVGGSAAAGAGAPDGTSAAPAAAPPGDDGSARIPAAWWEGNRRIRLRRIIPPPGALLTPAVTPLPHYTWLPRA